MLEGQAASQNSLFTLWSTGASGLIGWSRIRHQCQRWFVGFNPAVSKTALHTMRQVIRAHNFRRHTQVELAEIAETLNPLLRGWMNYYGRYRPSGLHPLYYYVNQTLVAWVRRKYKRLRRSKTGAILFIENIYRKNSRLFAHWQQSSVGASV